MRLSPRTVARIGICVQFAALIRCLAEFYRLKHILGPLFTIARIEPFILGSSVTALFAIAAVLSYLGGKYVAAAAIAAGNVVILLVLKVALS